MPWAACVGAVWLQLPVNPHHLLRHSPMASRFQWIVRLVYLDLCLNWVNMKKCCAVSSTISRPVLFEQSCRAWSRRLEIKHCMTTRLSLSLRDLSAPQQHLHAGGWDTTSSFALWKVLFSVPLVDIQPRSQDIADEGAGLVANDSSMGK